jgi:hypothetical protein
MSTFACPECANPLLDSGQVCTGCGWSRYRPSVATLSMSPDAAVIVDEDVAAFPLFPVATHKFVVLSLCSFGVYQLFWCYRNWQRIGDTSREAISPLWRAVFAPLWAFSLFGEIRDMARANEVRVAWNSTLLALLYLAFNLLWRLPDEIWWVAFGSLLPMIPVQYTAQQVNRSRAGLVTEDANVRYTWKNMVLICFGGLLLLATLMEPFLPE